MRCWSKARRLGSSVTFCADCSGKACFKAKPFNHVNQYSRIARPSRRAFRFDIDGLAVPVRSQHAEAGGAEYAGGAPPLTCSIQVALWIPEYRVNVR